MVHLSMYFLSESIPGGRPQGGGQNPLCRAPQARGPAQRDERPRKGREDGREPPRLDPAQCASAQLSPEPASTVSGMSRVTTGLAAFSMTARTRAVVSSTALSSTSNTNSS